MTTVCILGAGEVGGATARALAAGEVASRVVLLDAARGVAAGKALDLQQACAITGWHTALTGTDDWSRLTGATVCIVADPVPGGSWSDADTLLDRLQALAGEAPLVFAGTADPAPLIAAAAARGIPRRRLIGSAPHALLGSIAAIIALEARCSVSEVGVSILGAPPAVVVPWSEASIGGRALHRVLDASAVARLDARTARLWPPRPGALGLAAALVTQGLLQTSRRAFTVSTLLDGELGLRNRVGVVPARLSPAGIVRIDVPALETRERVRVDTALDA
jgi:malate dehydrogenase